MSLGISDRHILGLADWDRCRIERIFERARGEVSTRALDAVRARVLCTAFFSTSTRTRFGFESAMHRLGGRVLPFDHGSSRAASSWRESVYDTIQMLNGMADLVVLRTPRAEDLHEAVSAATIPVINGGNGVGAKSEHPTQALADIFWISERFGDVRSVKLLLIGPLGDRLTRSLLIGLDRLGVREIWMACPDLVSQAHPPLECDSIELRFVEDIRVRLHEFDVVYHNGVSEDGIADAPDRLSLFPSDVARMRADSVILHALPRSYEMPRSIDAFPQSCYFDQASSAVEFRKHLLLDGMGL